MIDIDNITDKYLNEKKDDATINWKHHFDAFGDKKKFLKATGITDEQLRLYVSTGEVPETARQLIRKAVAKRIINKI